MQLTNEWISGFVDGEGCFKIQKIKKKEKESIVILQPLVIEDEKPFTGVLRHCFIVSQDKRSLSVLYGLKRKFKCGTVHKAGGNMMAFQVSKSLHLEKIIIPFFQKYTLKTTKGESFRLFVESLEKLNKDKTRETEKLSSVYPLYPLNLVTQEKKQGCCIPSRDTTDKSSLRSLAAQGKQKYLSDGPFVSFEEKHRCQSCKDHKIVDKQKDCCDAHFSLFGTQHKVSTFAFRETLTYNFSDNWFCGFIDAKGCFSVSLVKDYPRVQLVIGVESKEKEMLVELQKFLKCGTLRTRKDGAEILQVVSSIDLERYIFPKLQRKGGAVLLQSSKRISYQKFRKIVRLITEKKHLTIEGLEKIKKYKTTLNKEKKKTIIYLSPKQKNRSL